MAKRKKRRICGSDFAKIDAHEIAAEEYDEMPELTDDFLDRAEIAIGGKIIRPAQGTFTRGRGRPKAPMPKKSVHLRLSQDVLEYFRNTGPGWQTRINEALRKTAKLGSKK